MKKILLSLTALGIMAVSCQEKNVLPEEPVNGNFSIEVEMEKNLETRATVELVEDSEADNAGKYRLVWTAGDKIAVFTNMQRSIPFTLTSGEGEAKGVFTGEFTPAVDGEEISYAIYPYHERHMIGYSMHLPSVYGSVEAPYVGNTNAIMSHFSMGNPGVMSTDEPAATPSVDAPKFSFKHAGGVLAVSLKGIPANVKGVVLTADKAITGDFEMSPNPLGNIWSITSEADANGTNNSVTINFMPEDKVRDEVFYFPLPIGTYKFKVEYINSEDEKVLVINSLADNSITRAKLLIMPELTIGNTPSSAELLKKAIEKGGTVTLTDNYVLDEALTISNDLILDLGEYTISTSKAVWEDGENHENDVWSVLAVKGEANVTINATTGGIKALENDAYAVHVDGEGAKLTINGGSYVGNVSAAYVYNGELVINGGHFDILQKSNLDDNRYLINAYDTNFNSGAAKISISGGEFVGFNPANSIGENPAANLLVKGYEAVETEGVWNVQMTASEELRQLIAKSSSVTLKKDYVLDEAIEITKKVTLNLGKYNITTKNNVWSDVENANEDVLAVLNLRSGADVTINTTTGGGIQSLANDAYAVCVDDASAKLTIKGGNFVGNISAVYVRNGSLTISGGKFDVAQLSDQNDKRYLINCFDDNYAAKTAKVSITGGEFVGFNPAESLSENPAANFVPEGYQAVEENGVYKVVKVMVLSLKPNAEWTGTDAEYAAYFWTGTGDTNKWLDMTPSATTSGLYEVTAPYGYSKVIFVKKNDPNTDPSWDNVEKVNDKNRQTPDLTVPSNTSTSTVYCLLTYGNEGDWKTVSASKTFLGMKYISSLSDKSMLPEGTWYITGTFCDWGTSRNKQFNQFDGKHLIFQSFYVAPTVADTQFKFYLDQDWNKGNFGLASDATSAVNKALPLTNGGANMALPETNTRYDVYLDVVGKVAYIMDAKKIPSSIVE